MQRNLITLSKRTLIFRGSKSAKGDPYLLADLDRGVQIRGVGGKSKSAVTCARGHVSMSFAIKSQYSSLGNT